MSLQSPHKASFLKDCTDSPYIQQGVLTIGMVNHKYTDPRVQKAHSPWSTQTSLLNFSIALLDLILFVYHMLGLIFAVERRCEAKTHTTGTDSENVVRSCEYYALIRPLLNRFIMGSLVN